MTTLSWKGYVQWAHEKAHDIFHHIGDGSDSSDAVYALLKTILEYCIHDYYPRDGKEISITINSFNSNAGDFWISVKGEGLHLTSDTLRCIVADTEKIHKYLFMLSETKDKRIPIEVVNALSSFFSISSIQDRMAAILKYEDAEEYYDLTDKNEEDGIGFRIVPDETVFGKYSLQTEPILAILYNLLKDNPGLTLTLKQGFNGKPLAFHSESLAKADARISDAVSHKIVDIQSDDYQGLLRCAQAISIVIPTEGSSSDIADRMESVINGLGSESKDILYAVEVENRMTMVPDSSIISQSMNMYYNAKKEIIGTDSEEDKEGFTMYHVYTNVIVGVILSTINQDNNR